MCKMVKLLFAAAVLVACLAVQIGALDVETAWENFQAHFPQNTKSEDELARRKSNFARTHAEIEEHNNGDSTFEREHNKFSVMGDEEKESFLGALPVVPEGARYLTLNEPAERQSTSFDWRTHTCMPAVKNQASCGSCWAFAATSVVEFGKCVKTGTKVSLSEQQLVDCAKTNFACNGGWYDEAWKYLSKNSKGQYTSASYPYKGVNGTCTTGTQGALVSSKSAASYVNSKDVVTMKKLLSQKRLFSVTIAVVNSFFSYKSGVYNEAKCDTGIVGYHAITVVGYGTLSLNGLDYWVIRNSWGSGWGAAGYVLFRRGTNLCLVEEYAVTTTIVG